MSSGTNSSSATEIFERLMETLQHRVSEQPAGSYTTRLVQGGAAKIGEKIIEEAAEVVEAACESAPENREHLIHEAADLLFHTFVMLAFHKIKLSEIGYELARREGISGLEEKRQRVSNPKNDNQNSA